MHLKICAPIALTERNASSSRMITSRLTLPPSTLPEVVAHGGQRPKSVVDSKLLSVASLQQESVQKKLPLRLSKRCRESEWPRFQSAWQSSASVIVAMLPLRVGRMTV